MSNVLKNLLIALAITLVLVLVYYFFIRDRLGQSSDPLEANLPTYSSASVEIERILSDTQKIQSYRVDANDDFLTEQSFRSLVDRRIDIQDVPTGRPNPFAPVQ